jgi:hypothetical protein
VSANIARKMCKFSFPRIRQTINQIGRQALISACSLPRAGGLSEARQE